jgi:DNA primase
MDEAKDRHSLSDIIGRHTTLKRRGNRELVGLCPFHSEQTASFEVNDTKGTYHCWGCGKAGDAFTFLRDKEGMSFRQAFETLSGDEFPTITDEERAKRKAADAAALAARIADAREIWSRSVPAADTPAEVYARSRGITMPLPYNIRFVMTPRWRDPETGETGRDYPAMACALEDRAGAIVAVQCVFLADGGRRKYERVRDDGTKAKAKLSFGAIVGAAVRLGTRFYGDAVENGPVTEVIVCEGPEDGLTLAQELPGKAVWVACGTAMMSRIDLPSEIRTVTLAGDNNAAGETAVLQSREAYIAHGLEVRTMYPSAGFKDWNDQLRGIRA